MTKNKITDEQLMMFADGELNNKELAMDIVAKILEDSDEGYDIRQRLDVFVQTRSALINSLIGDKNDTG
tara:strand:- start:152 stop:358 length:207 start_codon:yes stop_codon:yes gene_type:complete